MCVARNIAVNMFVHSQSTIDATRTHPWWSWSDKVMPRATTRCSALLQRTKRAPPLAVHIPHSSWHGFCFGSLMSGARIAGSPVRFGALCRPKPGPRFGSDFHD